MDDADEMVVREETTEADDRPRVVILGGGFGGIYTARHLKGADCQVVVVDKQNHHLFQPLLYQVATAGLSPGDIASPIRSILGRQQNARVLLGEALEVDRAEKTVRLANGTISYDFLVVATGTQPQYFGPDSYEEHSTPLKTIEDALELRRQILCAFEQAEQIDDPAAVREWLTFVIVGGGATGVEMAGAFVELFDTLNDDFSRFDTREEARCILLEMEDDLLPPYKSSLRAYTRDVLERRGVEVRTNTAVERVEADTVHLSAGCPIPAQTLVWAAGVEASPVADLLGA
ncbi:MAG: NAD(P)/FAD-dependent oxidoreductase, partial [Bradymonadaceae bacterium]